MLRVIIISKPNCQRNALTDFCAAVAMEAVLMTGLTFVSWVQIKTL